MREITKRLLQMSNQLGYQQREEERIAIVKEHLTDYLEDADLTLQDIAEQTDLIHEHYIYNEWMVWTYDIYLFFDLDLLDFANDYLEEFGSTEINELALIDYYAHNIAFEHIDDWAKEEERTANEKKSLTIK